MANEPTVFVKGKGKGQLTRLVRTASDEVNARFEGFKPAPKEEAEAAVENDADTPTEKSNTGGGNDSADARNTAGLQTADLPDKPAAAKKAAAPKPTAPSN